MINKECYGETGPGEIEPSVMLLGAAYAATIIGLILWLAA